MVLSFLLLLLFCVLLLLFVTTACFVCSIVIGNPVVIHFTPAPCKIIGKICGIMLRLASQSNERWKRKYKTPTNNAEPYWSQCTWWSILWWTGSVHLTNFAGGVRELLNSIGCIDLSHAWMNAPTYIIISMMIIRRQMPWLIMVNLQQTVANGCV